MEIEKRVAIKVSANFDACVQFARDIFDTNFIHNIRDLVAMFAPDHLDRDG